MIELTTVLKICSFGEADFLLSIQGKGWNKYSKSELILAKNQPNSILSDFEFFKKYVRWYTFWPPERSQSWCCSFSHDFDDNLSAPVIFVQLFSRCANQYPSSFKIAVWPPPEKERTLHTVPGKIQKWTFLSKQNSIAKIDFT